MKKNTKLIALSSILVCGLISTTLFSCANNQSSNVTNNEHNILVESIPEVKVSTSKSKYAVGETVIFTLEIPENVIFSGVSLNNDTQLLKRGENKYMFIMPNKDTKIIVDAKINVHLKNRLQELVDARNYTVVSRVTFTNGSYDSIVYYTENANLMHLENDENTLEQGEINAPDGVYEYNIFEDENGEEKFVTSKITYNSYINGVKSFWDRKHEHGGFHKLDLSYINENDQEYVFKLKEIDNQSNIFYNSGLDFSTYLSALKEITVFINKKGNIEFLLDLGKFGNVTEEVVNVGTTKISQVDNFLKNGGGPIPTALTEEQKATEKLIKENNYKEVLPQVKTKDGRELDQGTIYYNEKYLFVDYTDEFLDFFNSNNNGIAIYDNGYMQVKDDVVEFKITYDDSKNPTFVLNEQTKVKGYLPEVAGYLSTTGFMKNFIHSTPDYLQINANSYLPFDRIYNYDLAREVGEKIFHLDKNVLEEEMLLLTSEGVGITPIVNNLMFIIYINNGDPYPTIYEEFGKTSVKLIEDKIVELEALEQK